MTVTNLRRKLPLRKRRTVLSAWANSGDPAAVKRAEALLEHMQELHEAGNVDVKPNTICFTTVLSVWSKSRDPATAK